MLKPRRDIFCGIFDSTISRKGAAHSTDRLVENYELEIFHSDTGTSYVNGVKHPVRRGMLLCAKPGYIRHSDFPVRCGYICISPNEDLDPDLANILSGIPDCAYIDNPDKTEEMLALYSQLGSCFLSPIDSQRDMLTVNTLFYEILNKLVRIHKNATDCNLPPEISGIAREAYNFINENYAHHCSLGVIAEAVSVSPNYLHTVFTQSIGISPYEYVVAKRLEQARKLIMAGEKNMLEIALEIGFSSQSHFCKVFKDKLGETPGEYKKRLFSDI